MVRMVLPAGRMAVDRRHRWSFRGARRRPRHPGCPMAAAGWWLWSPDGRRRRRGGDDEVLTPVTVRLSAWAWPRTSAGGHPTCVDRRPAFRDPSPRESHRPKRGPQQRARPRDPRRAMRRRHATRIPHRHTHAHMHVRLA